MKKIDRIGYIFSLLLGLALFLSVKLQNALGILLLILFIFTMFSKDSREIFKKNIDKKISFGLLLFIATPYVIALIDGGIKSRIDMDDYLKFLMFFPLVFFLREEKRFWNFTKILLTGGITSLIISTILFIKNYESWSNPQGFHYERVYFAIAIQDFANIMSILLLFLISFFLFYNLEDKEKNKKLKIFLVSVIVLNIFILLVSRSKMIYICLIPTISYILWKKNKKYILAFFTMCCGGYFLLPKSISDRLQYIVKFKQDPSSNLRLIFWDGAIQSFKEKPLFGMKSEERYNFTRNYYKMKNFYDYVISNYNFEGKMRDGLNTHNMYLQYLVCFGIGFISLIILFFIVIPNRLFKLTFYKENKNPKYIAFEVALKSSYVCYLIQGLTEINLNNKTMIIVFSIILYFINFIYKRLLK